MSFKIVSDSSADVIDLRHVDFVSVPLMITVGEHTFVDDAALDVPDMLAKLKAHKGRSVTACPSPDAWLRAFGDADDIVCFTITSALSGCYNSAVVARDEYMRLHPGRRVIVVDTLSTGPEMSLLIEKAEKLHLAGLDLEEIGRALDDYRQHTHLFFSLQSLRNLANNGRVSPAVATLAGLLGIRVVGCASQQGQLEPLARCRGESRTLSTLVSLITERGYAGGSLRITHCENESSAKTLSDLLLNQFPGSDIRVGLTRGLCSFYAEQGGLLIGFES